MHVLNWPRICVVYGDPDNEKTLYPYLLRDGETGRGMDLPQERQDEIEGRAREIGELGQRMYAQEFEDKVAATLDRLGISYTRPAKGPDFILLESLTINGHVTKWIEVKALGVGQIPDTANRYKNEYGPGCMAFGRGFHQAFEARMKNMAHSVMLLDASDEALQGIQPC